MLIINVIFGKLDELFAFLRSDKKQWPAFFELVILSAGAGFILGLRTNMHGLQLGRLLVGTFTSVGAILGLLFSILALFVLFFVFKLIFGLEISNRELYKVGLIGNVPNVLGTIFTAICTLIFGFNEKGYTSVQSFAETEVKPLAAFYNILDPFTIAEILLVSYLVARFTNKMKLLPVFVGIWLVIKYAFGFIG
ncbi:hypothetical protein [Liquorilactobacillus capillatus]|uniref:Yip1 domain-containing protein n=1 Tax=Liquorilactobacillus capillatus DSM 19910 TaxID=1423731 RepID=A0A0R1MFL4_9LACO|nr:hypothetical protein [Liquorilactobacillus capillatus]KRL02408.1 hypothetical protein FC81_GL000752 [Liquorilactobacillus capillatus DSM 19910]